MKNLFFILFFVFFRCVFSDFFIHEEIFIYFYEYNSNFSFYNISQINEISFSKKDAKFTVINSEEKFLKVLNFSFYINKNWIFFCSNESLIDFILTKNKDSIKKSNLNNLGLIVPSSFKNKFKNKFKNEKKIPFFAIDEENTKNFNYFDFFSFKKEIYTIFETKDILIYKYPLNYFKIIGIFFLIVSISLAIFWNLELKKIQNTTLLQKYYVYLIYLSFVLALLILSEIYIIDKESLKNSLQEKNNEIYVIETAIVTIKSVYRTGLWLSIILNSYGWQLSRLNLQTGQVRLLLTLFFLIFMSQFIDAIHYKISMFTLSEIKNFFFYVFMLYLSFIEGNKIRKFFRTKLTYAIILNREHIPTIKIKLNMIENLLFLVSMYVFFYVFLCWSNKIFFKKFDTEEFQIIQYFLLDFFLMLGILFIFRPKNYPLYFYDFQINEINIGTVYILNIKKNNFVIDFKTVFKEKKINEKMNKKNKLIPVVILNPMKNNNNNNNKENIQNQIIKNINLGFLND